MVLQMQSKCYKRKLRRKLEKERQKRIRRSEVNRIVTQVQKSFGDKESSELDENLNENSDESLESEIFCEQSQETVIASNRFSCDRIEHARESHDFECEMNNDSFVADSEEELLLVNGLLVIIIQLIAMKMSSLGLRVTMMMMFSNFLMKLKKCTLQKQSVSGHWRGEFSPWKN